MIQQTFIFGDCKDMAYDLIDNSDLDFILGIGIEAPPVAPRVVPFDHSIRLTNNVSELDDKDKETLRLLRSLRYNTEPPLFGGNYHIRIRNVDINSQEGDVILRLFEKDTVSYLMESPLYLHTNDNKVAIISNNTIDPNSSELHRKVYDLVQHLRSYGNHNSFGPYYIERVVRNGPLPPFLSQSPSRPQSQPQSPTGPENPQSLIPSPSSSTSSRIVPARISAVSTEEVQQRNLLMSCVEKCYQDYNLSVPDIVRNGIIGLPSSEAVDALRINRIHRPQSNDDSDDEDVPIMPPVVGSIHQQLNLPEDINVTLEGHERCKKLSGKQVASVMKAMIALHQARTEKVTGPAIIEYLLLNDLVRSYYTSHMPQEIKDLGPEYFVIKVPEQFQPMVQPTTNNNQELDRWTAHQQKSDKDLKRRLQTSVARSLAYIKNKNCAVSTARGVYKYDAV